MTDPVNAAWVVARDVRRRFPSNPDVVCGREGHAIVDALLACGAGDPVVIMPDGTLRRLKLPPHFVATGGVGTLPNPTRHAVMDLLTDPVVPE